MKRNSDSYQLLRGRPDIALAVSKIVARKPATQRPLRVGSSH